MKVRVLDSKLQVPVPRPEVFSYFADVMNLDAITPPWLHFHIMSRGVEVKKGALIRYRLRIHGIPVYWTSEITQWEPPYHFVDEQTKGPYNQWIHEHRFEENESGTLILDHVEYAVPGWILEPVFHRMFVFPDLQKIFKYRTEKLQKHFASWKGK